MLLDAHVLQKALYEVRYELANRPAWVAWPLAAIAQMLGGSHP
jgi:predicted trehalose synthase